MMIDFVVVSSDLQLNVLDTWTVDHHRVVRWIRGQGRIQDRFGKPKQVVKVKWESLLFTWTQITPPEEMF